MQKTKLGVSVGLLGAALYFVGTISIIPLIILAGYVLLYEENEWLKKAAVKSIIIVIGFAIVITILGLADDIYSILDEILALFKISISIGGINRLLSIAKTGVYFVEAIILVICGLKALHQEDFKVSAIDNTINKHM